MKKTNSILFNALLSLVALIGNNNISAQFHSSTDIVEATSSTSIAELIEKDGNLYYVTTTSESVFTNNESCITKVNISTGDTLQEICFEADGFFSMAVDDEENIIISFRPEVDFDYDPNDANEVTSSCDGSGCMALLKYDSNSNLIFSNFFSNGLGFSLNDIVTDTDNNIYITGQERYSRIDYDPSANSAKITGYDERDCFLVKYGADGSFKWLNTYGGEENDYAYAMTISENNELTILGSYYSGSFITETDTLPNNNAESTRNLFILKCDSAGNTQSTQYFNAIGTPTVSDVHLSEDGILTFVGSTNSFLFYVDPEDDSETLISQNNEGYIIQLDEDGALVNSLTTDDFYFSTLDLDSEGNIYANGVFGYDGEIDVDPSDDNEVNYTTNGLSDHVWVKYSSDFEYLNSGHFGGSRQAFAITRGLVVLGEDDFFLGGKVGGTTQSEVIVDFDPLPDSEFELQITTLNGALFLTRYTPEGITGLNDITEQNYSIFPNPSTGNLNFELESTVEKIAIRNAQGSTIQSIEIPSNGTIDIDGLDQGIYFISGYNHQGELTFTEKVLIQE